jgi:hypothetical protein
MMTMPKFNLADYETVEERIKKFYVEHPDGRIVTELVHFDDVHPRTWVFKASVYLTAGDQAAGLPKATGYASEIDGTGGANNGSAAENSETSSIGRCLSNANWSGNKRASRQEMAKVNNLAERDWVSEADKITEVTALRWLYAQAKGAGAAAEQLERIQSRAELLNSGSESKRAD